MWIRHDDVVVEWMQNIVEKGENAGKQHFLIFLQCLD